MQPIMNVANLSESDNNNTDASLSCERCHKSYQRRMSFFHFLHTLLTYPMKVTYSCAIVGAAKGPKDLSIVVKPVTPVLRQGPNAAILAQRVCVV